MTDSALNDATRERIAPVLGRLPSGVSILTAGDGGERETGMLASWVQQASFDPPMVTLAVNAKRYLNDWLQPGAPLVLNLLGEDNGALLKHFGKGFEPDEPAFEGVNTSRADNGLPVLGDALGYLEGNVAGQTPAGDHLVYVVEITGAGSAALLNDSKPMVHIRKTGFHY
ncbi:MAG: flavin reductase family protein [Planctomycetaceae bacterium]